MSRCLANRNESRRSKPSLPSATGGSEVTVSVPGLALKYGYHTPLAQGIKQRFLNCELEGRILPGRALNHWLGRWRRGYRGPAPPGSVRFVCNPASTASASASLQ